MKKIFLLLACLCGIFVCTVPAVAQKLPVSSKGFEKLARSIFLKEGGHADKFPQFYKEMRSAFKNNQEIRRAELTQIARIYLNTKSHVSKAYELSKQHKLHNQLPERLPSDIPFISQDNYLLVSAKVWNRDNLGTGEELQKLQEVLFSFFNKYPTKQLTLQEFYYVCSKYMFEGEKSLEGFFERIPARGFLVHVQASRRPLRDLDVYVYEDQVNLVLERYYSGKPFRVKKGRLAEW